MTKGRDDGGIISIIIRRPPGLHAWHSDRREFAVRGVRPTPLLVACLARCGRTQLCSSCVSWDRRLVARALRWGWDLPKDACPMPTRYSKAKTTSAIAPRGRSRSAPVDHGACARPSGLRAHARLPLHTRTPSVSPCRVLRSAASASSVDSSCAVRNERDASAATNGRHASWSRWYRSGCKAEQSRMMIHDGRHERATWRRRALRTGSCLVAEGHCLHFLRATAPRPILPPPPPPPPRPTLRLQLRLLSSDTSCSRACHLAARVQCRPRSSPRARLQLRTLHMRHTPLIGPDALPGITCMTHLS